MREGDIEAGRATFRESGSLLAFFDRHLYVATMKAILNEQGRAVGTPREPVLPLEDESRAALRREMDRLGLR